MEDPFPAFTGLVADKVKVGTIVSPVTVMGIVVIFPLGVVATIFTIPSGYEPI